MAVEAERLLDEAPCGLLLLDPTGDVAWCNTTLAALTRREASSVVGHPAAGLFTAPGRVFFHTHLLPTLRLGGDLSEIVLTLADGGSGLPVQLSARRLTPSEQYLVAITSAELRDSWERRALAAARDAERERDEARQLAQELAAAKAQIEETLAELQASHWLLRRVAEVLPMCVNCGQVRVGHDGWQSLAEFFREHSSFVSHGCCPRCESVVRAQMLGQAPA